MYIVDSKKNKKKVGIYRYIMYIYIYFCNKNN